VRMEHKPYIAEEYWDSVAITIKNRDKKSLIAGDDEPYYSYKRKKFLKLLHSISFHSKKVLEIGCGPGGNLIELVKDRPELLAGVDISNEMVRLSKELLGDQAEIIKINGTTLPFGANHFEIVFTSTVLQHITDESILSDLVKEICRVSLKDVYIFEGVEKKRKQNLSNVGRTINEYLRLFQANNFLLEEVKFLNMHWSWLVCGTIRRVFNSRKRKEGEKETDVSRLFQRIVLVITKPLDELFPIQRDLAMLHFKKINSL